MLGIAHGRGVRGLRKPLAPYEKSRKLRNHAQGRTKPGEMSRYAPIYSSSLLFALHRPRTQSGQTHSKTHATNEHRTEKPALPRFILMAALFASVLAPPGAAIIVIHPDPRPHITLLFLHAKFFHPTAPLRTSLATFVYIQFNTRTILPQRTLKNNQL